MKFYPEVLGATQKRVLRAMVSAVSERGFYLAGGTAIALQLGHRRSIDFDWFTGEAIGDALQLAQAIQSRGVPLTITEVSVGTLHATIYDVRVSFLEYRYPLLEPTVLWSEYGCPLASLDDLACMKLTAVTQRGAKKDFIDIYALGLRHVSLSRMLELYRRKYSIENITHVLYGLAYFDDADKERLPRMLWKVNWRTIKTTLQKWTREITK